MWLYAAVRRLEASVQALRKAAEWSWWDFVQRFRRPGAASNEQVASSCQLNYGVTFPMFEKTTVTGAGANALYAISPRRSGSPPQ
jgi:glutathione peroxidase-family protein